MSEISENIQYVSLISQIGQLLQQGREASIRFVNTTLVQTYWHIGKYIVEFEQNGEKKAEYGTELLDHLSKDLTASYGKGFSRSNLFQMRQFYIKFPKIQTVSVQLTWSHLAEIIKADDALEIAFYVKQCEKENWSFRELRRHMNSMLFHRLALSTDNVF